MSDEPPLHPPIPFKRVRVVWLDAYSTDGWEKINPKGAIEDRPCITIGWLTREGKSYIEVAPTVGQTVDDPSIWELAHSMVIPRKMILDMKEEA